MKNLEKKPIKSVHITNYYHEKSGGVKASYDKLLEEANRHQRYVRLIVPGETEKTIDIGEYGKIYFVSAKPSPIFDKRYRLMLPFDYLPNESPVRKILFDEMPNMIEIYDNYALTLLAGMVRIGKYKQLNRPMLVYFTGERFDTIFKSYVTKGKFGDWFPRRLMGNYNLAMFDFFIANSPFVAEELFQSVNKSENPKRNNWFFNKCWQFFKSSQVPFSERVAVCPRGVNINHFSPNRKSESFKVEMREKNNIPANSKILLSSTRISPEKNIEFLVELMKVLAKDERTDYRILIAGAGPKEDWIREKTAKLFPNKIVLTGHLDKETLANYYANCDVFIHPNPREPFGNVGLEAMASGAALLAPNSGGILTYATLENAWLCEPKAETFAEAVREIIENKGLCEKKQAKAIETAKVNSQESANSLLFTTYDKMYEDFQNRNELFTNKEKAKKFDFSKLI